MVDRDLQTRFTETIFRLKQQSSYNRASVNKNDNIGWFNNHDFNSNDKDQNFIKIEEKIYIDKEYFPSIFGSGTEDYYAYSWGGKSTDFYEHPFHAQPRSNVYNKLNRKTTKERNTQVFSNKVRTRALDVMPFKTSLDFDMEIWSWADCDMGYEVSLLWYGDEATKSNRAPDEKEV